MANLTALVRRLLEFTGWRAATIVGLMLAAALGEGLGLLLLVPLLTASGVVQADSSDSVLAGPINALHTIFGSDLLLEQLFADVGATKWRFF